MRWACRRARGTVERTCVVWTSTPLSRGAQKAVMAAPQLAGVTKPAVAALLVAKSTPFLVTALVRTKG